MHAEPRRELKGIRGVAPCHVGPVSLLSRRRPFGYRRRLRKPDRLSWPGVGPLSARSRRHLQPVCVHDSGGGTYGAHRAACRRIQSRNACTPGFSNESGGE